MAEAFNAPPATAASTSSLHDNLKHLELIKMSKPLITEAFDLLILH